MKKFLALFSAVLIIFTAFMGSGCKNKDYLEFNNNYVSSATAIAPGYTETLTYKVEYVEDYNSSLKNVVSKDLLTTTLSGSYVSVLEVINHLPDGISTDIETANLQILQLKTTLTLTGSYNDKPVNDKVVTNAYFLNEGQSFAPIYTRSDRAQTYVAVNGNEILTQKQFYIYETKYNKENYTVNKFAFEKEEDFVVGIEKGKHMTGSPETYNKKKKYGFRQVIDNEQLLFIIRNMNIAEEGSINLKVVTPVYGAPHEIKINNKNVSTKQVTINGITEEIPVDNLTFGANSIKNSGTAHYVTVQKKSDDMITKYSALPVEYAAALIESAMSKVIGSLKYTLTSVNVTNA